MSGSNLLEVPDRGPARLDGLKHSLSSNDLTTLSAALSRTASSLAPSPAGSDVPPDYLNPLESSSRWYLNAKAQAVRYAANVGFSIMNRTDPPVPSPSREIWLDSTFSQWKGREKIKVEVWYPPRISIGPRAAIINFHGGGWILGQGTDDARWAGAVMDDLDSVVFTVNYRLAPSYPFPTAIEDCVDAVMQIASRSSEFGIDPDHIILSGFSAGATNAITSWIVMQEPSRWDYELPSTPPTIAGLVMFYPTLDVTTSRPGKRQLCLKPERTLAPGLTDLIDASYFYPSVPPEKRTDPRISPGLMSDALLKKLPPVHLCICEYDMLLAEGIRFAERLDQNDKTFTFRLVDGEGHAWDKPLPMTPKPSVFVEYGKATHSVARWLGRERQTDQESVSSFRSRRRGIRRPKSLSIRSRSVQFLTGSSSSSR